MDSKTPTEIYYRPSMTKITPKTVDSVTVDHLQDIEIGKT